MHSGWPHNASAGVCVGLLDPLKIRIQFKTTRNQLVRKHLNHSNMLHNDYLHKHRVTAQLIRSKKLLCAAQVCRPAQQAAVQSVISVGKIKDLGPVCFACCFTQSADSIRKKTASNSGHSALDAVLRLAQATN
jgi:hypothetical protein